MPNTVLPARTPRLVARDIGKRFDGVPALNGVSLSVEPGEIHALIGENGAGKSTLMRVIAGVTKPDEGRIQIDDFEVGAGYDERQAIDLGVGLVHQERSLVPQLSVAENTFGGQPPAIVSGFLDRRQMHREATRILNSLEAGISSRAIVRNLSSAQQQMVEIAKALTHPLRLLILDEPTAALTLTETHRLFEVVRGLAARGISVIYISHRLNEVRQIADNLTVMRDGEVVGSRKAADTSEAEMVRLMVGRDLPTNERRVVFDRASRPVLSATHIHSSPYLKDASLSVRSGEIVCLAGLIGSGRSELCEAIVGIRRHRGNVNLDGEGIKIRDPAHARKLGIGLIPEDRQAAGLFTEMSVAENIASSNLEKLSPRGILRRKLTNELCLDQMKVLSIVPPDPGRKISTLSGGNQQKTLLARWLAREPRVLIVDEPTRGVDIGARALIYRAIRDLAANGAGIVVVSSDLPEVLALADRIIVMREGVTSGELDGRTATEEDILRLASPPTKSGGVSEQ